MVNTTQELSGLFHPIAVALIEELVKLAPAFHYRTLPDISIEVKRRDGSLIALLGFVDAEFRLLLYPDYSSTGDPRGILPQSFDWKDSYTAFAYDDPSASIEETARRIARYIIDIDIP